jgi:hypothetical protein
MKVNFSDLIKAISSDMKAHDFNCEKVQAVRDALEALEKRLDINANAGENLTFAEVLNLLTSKEYTYENQITDFGQKSNPEYSGDDIDYKTVDFTDEMHEYFTKNLASICEEEFEVEDAKTLTFIF